MLLDPRPAECAFATDSFFIAVSYCIRKSTASSKPFPFDQILYYKLKKYPSLLPDSAAICQTQYLVYCLKSRWPGSAIHHLLPISAVTGKWTRLVISRDPMVSDLAATVVSQHLVGGCASASTIMQVWPANCHTYHQQIN